MSPSPEHSRRNSRPGRGREFLHWPFLWFLWAPPAQTHVSVGLSSFFCVRSPSSLYRLMRQFPTPGMVFFFFFCLSFEILWKEIGKWREGSKWKGEKPGLEAEKTRESRGSGRQGRQFWPRRPKQRFGPGEQGAFSRGAEGPCGLDRHKEEGECLRAPTGSHGFAL